MKKYPFLEEFDLSTWDRHGRSKSTIIGTLVNSKYQNVKPTPILQLLEIIQDPAGFEHQRFLIKGYILNFNYTKVQDMVKKVSDKKVLDFNAKLADKNPTYIYHFIANIKDSSVENDTRNLNVYILTNEEDQHLFDLWDILPSPHEVAKWQSLTKSEMDKFEKRLHSLTAPEVEVRMVVELLITASGKAFFKLYDTVFV